MSVAREDESPTFTLDEYLKFEEASEARHELVGGRVELMAGGTERHDLMVLKLTLTLGNALTGRCRVFPHNRKVRLPGGDVRYADLLVHCGSRASKQYEDDAHYLVEVRSPDNTPRRLAKKIGEYRQLPSLRQILVVDPDRREVLLHQRHDLGWSEEWVEGVIRFADVDLDLEDLYRRVDLEATGD